MASKLLRQIHKLNGFSNRTSEIVSGNYGLCIVRGGFRLCGLTYQQVPRFLVPVSSRTAGFNQFHTSSLSLGEIKTVKCPPFAESITEGDVRWEVAVGDSVTEDQVVAEIETDKTTVPVPSPAAGVVTELLIPDGERVEAGAELFKLEVGAGGGSAPKPAAAEPPPPPAAAPPPPAAAPPPPAVAAPPPPPIPTTMPPVPPIPTKPLSVTPAGSVIPVKAVDHNVIGGSRAETRVKMNRMRLKIAQRLKDAQNTCAMLTTFNEINMTNIIELRKSYQDEFVKKHGIKLGFMSAFLKASAYALSDQPVVNGVIDGNEIVYRDFIDISVAVASPKGLVVPVIRNVEQMNYVEIEKTLVELGEKARKGDLAIEDMDGGTFTVSNGGVFGSLMGTPIINPPQSAILGMHATLQRPVAVGGKVEIHPMMYIALTYDHRLIDGKEAVTFLKKIKSAVEDPRVIFLDL